MNADRAGTFGCQGIDNCSEATRGLRGGIGPERTTEPIHMMIANEASAVYEIQTIALLMESIAKTNAPRDSSRVPHRPAGRPAPFPKAWIPLRSRTKVKISNRDLEPEPAKATDPACRE
ncbi:hypothetical protein [Sinomonas sp. G460-2]|uniref:hypothetical protein n=1 Tax=Sinomonas sp. G460-2 TaxID=3393464 RepID=UPI0039F10BB4